MDPLGAGALGEIRTPDPQIRSLMLYPAELRALAGFVIQGLSSPSGTENHEALPRRGHPPLPSPYSASLRLCATGLAKKTPVLHLVKEVAVTTCRNRSLHVIVGDLDQSVLTLG